MSSGIVIRIVALLLLTILLAAPASSGAANPALPAAEVTGAVQSGADAATREAVTATAIELSQMEAARDFAGLYARLHPDSRATIPFEAFAGWYEALLAGKTTADLTVTSINLIDWTWEVNGTTYPGTAQVLTTQPYWINGVRTDVENVFHLVEAGGEWYWFFGGSQAFIEEQIARYGAGAAVGSASTGIDLAAATAARAELFPDPLHAHIDAYWAAEFEAAGRRYASPGGVIGFSAPIATACGMADPVMEAAFYCVLDQTIYYSDSFRAMIEREIGDYGWVVVVAHEWGHHVQLLLGSELVGALDQSSRMAPVALEQQADCLAGAYTQSAEATGWLDDTDVPEAIVMTGLSGDPIGTSWGDPNAHGSGEERVDAFLDGYEGGMPSCDLDLSDE